MRVVLIQLFCIVVVTAIALLGLTLFQLPSPLAIPQIWFSRLIPGFSNISDESLTFERRDRCNLANEGPCHSTNKSLVLTFWSERSRQKWFPQNIHLAFPSHSFDHLIFVFDNSSWHSHPAYHQSIWIHVQGQIRMWFVKRFLLPQMIRSYRYIWFMDDDSRLWFNPLHYECVIEQLHIPISSPARLGGALSHQITKVQNQYKAHIGRWTDLVETGPTVVWTSSAWSCLYHYLDPSTVSGWGFDFVYCNILADLCLPKSNRTRVCAILDVFRIEHQSETINSKGVGEEEMGVFDRRYRPWYTIQQTYGPLAENQSVFDKCNASILS